MFKLRDITLPDQYTDADLAHALSAVVTYTYGDRVALHGFDIVTVPGEGESETGALAINTCYVTVLPDATLFVTNYATGKLGVVPATEAESTFVNANATLMARIAQLMGYDDYVVYQWYRPGGSEHARLSWVTMAYNYADAQHPVLTGAGVSSPADAHCGILKASTDSKEMFSRVNGPSIGSAVVANGISLWGGQFFIIPEPYYMTDLQNVQDVCRKSVAVNGDDIDALIAANSTLRGVIESTVIFGSTFKSVVQSNDAMDRMSQYLPRP